MAVGNLRPLSSDIQTNTLSRWGISSLAGWFVYVALGALMLLGFAVRANVAWQQPLFIDEPFSLLAIQETAAHGMPMLPTGVLYLHGATMSYLLAPLSVFQLVQHDDLSLLRLVSAIAGTVAVYLTFRLARSVGCTAVVALFAAALLALDPASVEWGGYLRMYAPAQTLSLGVVLLYVQMLKGQAVAEGNGAGSRRTRIAVGLVAVFWLAVFTHLATALLLPAMVLVAIVAFRWELLRARRNVTAALIGCLMAPLVLIALSGLVGAGAGTKIAERAEGVPGIAFLGDDKINFQQLLKPDPAVWSSLFGPGPLENLLPLLVTMASTLILVSGIVPVTAKPLAPAVRRARFALLALYWLPVLALAFLAGDTSTRYGLFLIPLGCVILAIALEMVATLVSARFAVRRLVSTRGALVAIVLAALILTHEVVGVASVFRFATSERRDLMVTLQYVNEHRQPDEWVITAIPPPMSAYVLRTAARMAFLPGGELSNRALRYTRTGPDGQPVDYWLGLPALPTTRSLCELLEQAPGGWLIIPQVQWNSWGYSGGTNMRDNRRAEEMRQLISGTSWKTFEHEQGLVFRVRASDLWSESAQTTCAKATRQERKQPAED